MIRGFLFIAIFAVGFAAGGLFPSFSAQYHQRLQAQYEQVNLDLAPFKEIANRFHGGSLQALIQHHLNSTDPTFYAEGAAIQMMINNQTKLAESQAAAEASYVDQARWLFGNRDDAVVRSTWDAFQPVVVTTENAMTFSLAIATALLVLAWVLAAAIMAGIRRLTSAKRTPLT